MLKNVIIIAAKCAPEEEVLSYIEDAGLKAVELYLSSEILKDLGKVVKACKNFPFRYAVHAHNDGFSPQKLSELLEAINAEVAIFHNIYWEDEWENLAKTLKNTRTKICIENIYTSHEPLKFIRRYGFGSCLDLEHLQMECGGVYEEEFIPCIKRASHIHLTGYFFGTKLWHTHIHHSSKHSAYMLNLIKNTNYKGFVVSEAKTSLQTYSEFKKLNNFFQNWENSIK